MKAQDWIGGSNAGSTVAQLVFRPVTAKANSFHGIEATSDKSASVIAFLGGGAPVALTEAAPNNDTTLVVGSTAAAGFSGSDEIYIYNTLTKTGQIRTVSSVSGGTITISSGLTGAHEIATTRIFKLSTLQSIKVGNATKSLFQDTPFFVGGIGRPVVVRLDGTSACSINALAGEIID